MTGAIGGRRRPTISAEGVVTGNTFDKYGSQNPLIRRLMAGFGRSLDELLRRANPTSLLDVGCGEGVLAQRFASRLPAGRVVGVDVEEESIRAGWSRNGAPNLDYLAARAEQLPFADREFDLVCAIELLEHVRDPERALEEIRRCAGSHLLLSVPREPLWRALNVTRGAYLRELGNTPGHLHHWSKGSFHALAGRYGEVLEGRTPPPWTMLLLRV